MRMIRRKMSELSGEEIKEIERFLDNNFSTVFHEPGFNRIVAEVFKTKFSYYLVYNYDRKLIAICPLHSIKNGILTETYSNPAIYGIPYGGWVYEKNEVSLKILINLMQLTYKESITYWSCPQIKSDNYTQVKVKGRFETAIIDLALSVDDIKHKFVSKNCRHNINRAPRKGIIVEQLDQDNFSIFIRLCNSLKESVGLKYYPNAYYLKLFNHYSRKNSISAFVSKLNGKYLSAILVIGNRKIMHAWIAGRSEEIPKNVYQNELLWWEAIKWAKETGSRYYDLCVVEQERLPSIARFKLGFSKRIVPFYCVSKRKIGYRIISRIQKCF